MRRMILEELVLLGTNKSPAILSFEKGLNVISGDSDTGKTYAFQCLNYVLGADTLPKKIKEAEGYSEISLTFSVEGEKYQVKRFINSSQVTITHQGLVRTLSSKHNSANVNNLSMYLLNLIFGRSTGIIIKQSMDKTRTLSFRDLVHLCAVSETDILEETSAFQTDQYTEKTGRSSVFKYILTGIETPPNNSISNKDEKMRRAGVVDFLKEKKKTIEDEIAAIENDENFKQYSGNSTLSHMINAIGRHRRIIADINSKFSHNLSEIYHLKKKCYKYEVQLSDYKKLRNHYLSELNKNGIISTHADFILQLPRLECPVCSQVFNPSLISTNNEDVLFAYFSEVAEDLQKRIHDIDPLIQDLSQQLKDSQDEIKILEKENKDLSETILKEQKLLSTLNDNIAIMRQLDGMQRSIEIYRQELVTIESDIAAYSEKLPKSFNSSEEYYLQEYGLYCKHVETILKSWGISEDAKISFDPKGLDIIINDKPRSSWGKGYRALIMSAMIIGLMRFSFENDRLHPGFVILDSPLVSLKERKKSEGEQWIEDYVERKMIEDILNQDSSRQVIIFENKNLKFDFQYNYIEFLHEGGNRTGFIPEVQPL